MNRGELEIYKDIAVWFSDNAPPKWSKVHINMEMAITEEEIASSWVIRWYKGIFNKKVSHDISASEKKVMRDLFIELNNAFEEKGERWSACDFTLHSKGKYDVSFSYESPP